MVSNVRKLAKRLLGKSAPRQIAGEMVMNKILSEKTRLFNERRRIIEEKGIAIGLEVVLTTSGRVGKVSSLDNGFVHLDTYNNVPFHPKLIKVS